MHSAKVVWELWVLGLHEEAHQPRARDDLSDPLPFGEKDNNHKIKYLDNHVHLSFWAYGLKHGHMSDRMFKKSEGTDQRLKPNAEI